MHTFPLNHEGRRRAMALVSLYPAADSGPDSSHYYVSCGAYARNKGSGRMDYQGVSVHGRVPIRELVRWALRKGFLQWDRREDWGGGQT